MLHAFRLAHLNEPCDQCELRVGVEAHHITFRSRGGHDEPANLRWLCRTCHNEMHGL